jgi:hypothetical protein
MKRDHWLKLVMNRCQEVIDGKRFGGLPGNSWNGLLLTYCSIKTYAIQAEDPVLLLKRKLRQLKRRSKS